jgi:hypothetical protein
VGAAGFCSLISSLYSCAIVIISQVIGSLFVMFGVEDMTCCVKIYFIQYHILHTFFDKFRGDLNDVGVRCGITSEKLGYIYPTCTLRNTTLPPPLPLEALDHS